MRKITRKELYEKVWQEPMSKLAAEFGLSDVGLAKICKKHNIPKPPRGYWTRASLGYRVKKTALPKQDHDPTIRISPSESYLSRIDACHHYEGLKVLLDLPTIVVHEQLDTPHPLTKKADEIFEKSKPDKDGLLKARSGCLDIRVSLKNKQRALQIMDAVLKNMENLGCSVKIQGKETWVLMMGEELRFGLSEELDSTKIEEGNDESRRSFGFHHSGFQYLRNPSGRLCLSIYEIRGRHISYIRKNWRDTNKKLLEEQLNSFIVGLGKIVLQKRYKDAQDAEKERIQFEKHLEQQRQERLVHEKRQKINAEKTRVLGLFQDAENRAKSELIRNFITEVEEQYSAPDFAYKPATNLQEWLHWANLQADRLDPFTTSPPSILDEEADLEKMEEAFQEARSPFGWLKD